jgi:hypothetical protein
LVTITAGAGADLCGEQGFAGPSFGSQHYQLALSESAGPLIELVDAGKDL